jgi:methionyl-tRNA formyltransferase
MMQKITFLGYSKNETTLIIELEQRNCLVQTFSRKIDLSDVKGSDLIISFGYSHILKSDFIDNCGCPIINLHIAYLPFNKGAHPNFWSFYDGTPSGVSLHLIDEGIDTGPILYQKQIKFDHEKTFAETYKRLKKEIEGLFIENIQSILEKEWTERKQIEKGTLHYIRDLPKEFRGWDTLIEHEIKRLKKIRGI